MKNEFEMSMMGELNYFLGLQIKQRSDDIFIIQIYFDDIIFGSTNEKICRIMHEE